VKIFLCAAVLLVCPALAFGQGNPGPFGGLFGRTPQRTGTNYKVFEIRGSSGWQWNDFLSEQPSGNPEPPFSGGAGYAAAAASYDRHTDRLQLRAGSTVEFRNSLEDGTRGTTFDGGLMMNGRLTTRVSTEMAVNYRRSPFYQFYPSSEWMGVGVIVPGVPYELRTMGYDSGDARIGASFQYSKSSTLSASAERSEMRFATSPQHDVSAMEYNGLWSRRLNRSVSVRLGYGHRESRHHTAGDQKLVEEQIDAGVDFTRALTIAPRTTLGFMTHTSIVRRADRETLYRLNGELQLMRQFQRTWKLQVDARRATEVLAGFVEPLFTDSLSLSVSGLLSHRIEFSSLVAGQRGRLAYNREGGPFNMAGASTQLTFALSRRLAVFTQYGFYHHDAPNNTLSVTALGELSRQTLTAGVTTWLPVYVRERTPSDSR